MSCGVLALLLVALAVGSSPTRASAVTVHVEREGDVVVIEAQASVNADVPTAWRVLTDYERYVDFIPGLRSSRIVARRGASLTVEQSGDAPLWLFRMPLAISYEITEIPPRRIHSRARSRSLHALDSTYEITPTPAGVRLDYMGRLSPRALPWGRLELAAVEQSILREFGALADEIERAGGEGQEQRGSHSGQR
jgi:hypothetical protein